RNGELRPHDVSYASNARVWWRCDQKEHPDWLARVSDRTYRQTQCRLCAATARGHARRRKAPVLPRTRQTLAEDALLAAQWSPRNGDLRPEQVGRYSKLRAWWRCDENPEHEWQAEIATRTKKRTGCPLCWRNRLSSRGRPPASSIVVQIEARP